MNARCMPILAVAFFAALCLPVRAGTVTLCTAVADAGSGEVIRQEGDCETAVTPASTFKIPISLMGYDASILQDEHAPKWPFRKGYADWNPAWRTDTDPASWMKNSVVWYSQEITRALGEERFRRYVQAFDYGNEDVSGNPGKRDGLTNSWLGSSLRISPLGQLVFLGKLVRRELPVGAAAYEHTASLVDYGQQPGGWHVYGKTGAGLPRGADGRPIRGRPYGWYVGWATKGDRTVVFARLIQDSERQSVSPGIRARDSLIRDLFSTPDAL